MHPTINNLSSAERTAVDALLWLAHMPTAENQYDIPMHFHSHFPEYSVDFKKDRESVIKYTVLFASEQEHKLRDEEISSACTPKQRKPLTTTPMLDSSSTVSFRGLKEVKACLDLYFEKALSQNREHYTLQKKLLRL